MAFDLIESARIAPNKITLYLPGGNKHRRRTLFGTNSLLEVISPFLDYDSIAFDEPNEKNFTDVKSHLSVVVQRRRYTLAKFRSQFPTNDVVQHLREVCKFVTPRYGFSHSEVGFTALAFSSGICTPQLSRSDWIRVGDLFEALLALRSTSRESFTTFTASTCFRPSTSTGRSRVRG